MKSYFASSHEEEKQNWYLIFLKEKEETLVKESGYKKVKTQKKLYYCEQGKINYPFTYVRNSSGKIYSPLREYLNLGKNQKMSPDFKNKLILKTTRTTYQKCVEDIRDSFDVEISKRTLNRYVLKLNEEHSVTQKPSSDKRILVGDSTKVKSKSKGKHEVFGFIALNYETNESSLVAFEINQKPSEIAKKIDFNQYDVFVGDADLGLRNFYQGKIDFHLCHRHSINDVSYYLWMGGMKKKEKMYLMHEFESILYTLQKSTKKYWVDYDYKRLEKRINQTREALKNFACKLLSINKDQAGRFILDNFEYMLTAAKLALVGIKVPWTTNHAERLMQEMGVRTKKKGMTWTEKGLKVILNLILIRYFLAKNKRNYKEILFNKFKKVVEI